MRTLILTPDEARQAGGYPIERHFDLFQLDVLRERMVEVAIDRISYERHSLSKRAKDIGSAAVLVALVLLAAVWGIVLLPRLPVA